MIYTATNGSRWCVTHVCPPVPTRAYDWCASHENYDGAPDAGEARHLCVYAPTREALIAAVEARCACGLEREECDCGRCEPEDERDPLSPMQRDAQENPRDYEAHQ